jgi:hypothetical protein
VNSELVAAVNDMVGSMLPLLIGSLQRGGQSIGKLSKVSDFVGWLIQTRPDLCRSRFGGCLTWFVSLADRVLIDLDLSAQQKQLRMSSARLLSQAASVSDDTYVRAMLNRTGMLESVLLMLLSNSGSEGMFGSVVQGMMCTMAEHWLNSFLSGRASSLVERFGFLLMFCIFVACIIDFLLSERQNRFKIIACHSSTNPGFALGCDFQSDRFFGLWCCVCLWQLCPVVCSRLFVGTLSSH